ncbi:hypothetical protein [Lysobacter enzymogenes]|uniref:hypothetical protein n=1 Tax=Lysobacter enzymogenes TaxID=69 RepID=UPI000F4CF947|nr:hypothetical protein [Lysobacter enzymogenes]
MEIRPPSFAAGMKPQNFPECNRLRTRASERLWVPVFGRDHVAKHHETQARTNRGSPAGVIGVEEASGIGRGSSNVRPRRCIVRARIRDA